MILDLTSEPHGCLLRKILFCTLDYCDQFSLVFHSKSRQSRIAEALAPYLLETHLQDQWPGTVIGGGGAQVNYYRLNPQTIDLILNASDRLYGWVEWDNSLPEDLALYRQDRTPFLGTISHETDGFFVVSDDEYYRLSEAVPEILQITEIRSLE